MGKCGCGRSEEGCLGLHRLTQEEWALMGQQGGDEVSETQKKLRGLTEELGCTIFVLREQLKGLSQL